MIRTDMFFGSEVQAAMNQTQPVLREQLQQLGISRDPTKDEVVAFSLKWLEDHLPDDLGAAYAVYLQYRDAPPVNLKVTLDEEADARIQRIGQRLNHLGGIRSPKGYNKKLIILLALLSAAEEEGRDASTS